MCTFVDYVTGLGFEDVRLARTKNDAKLLRGCHYATFDAALVRQTLGRAKKFKNGMFVYVISKTQAIRVDTIRKVVLLGNGERAISAFLKSVK